MTIPTRERILRAAEDLYVVRGHDGFSFGDIAAEVQTTRANIHHHFGNKRRLMGELLERFATDAEARIGAIWSKPGASFQQRMDTQRKDFRRFYRRFNPESGSRNVWSPVARVRLDSSALGELADAVLRRVNGAYERALRQALEGAVSTGELQAETPVVELVRVLRITLLSCGPATQDSGSFEDVDHLLRSMGRLVLSAWGFARDGIDKPVRRSGY
jgi:AcrR family transcriptional regulator